MEGLSTRLMDKLEEFGGLISSRTWSRGGRSGFFFFFLVSRAAIEEQGVQGRSIDTQSAGFHSEFFLIGLYFQRLGF